jgi:hypothetical protein
MPQLTSIEGTVTAAFKSGLKVDRVWRQYGEAFRKVDLRAGDKVRCSLDGQGHVALLEITERGTGAVPADTMTDKQKEFVRTLLDNRELTPQAFEQDFLRKYLGKGLDELSRYEGQCVLDLLTGRTEPYRPKGGGRRF